MSGRWKRILALGAAVVLCLIAAAQMGSLFHWKVTCTPAAFAESSRRLSNPDRGFYYIYGYRITDEPVDYATDLRDRTREDDLWSFRRARILSRISPAWVRSPDFFTKL